MGNQYTCQETGQMRYFEKTSICVKASIIMFIQHRVKDGYNNDKNMGPLKTRRKKGIHQGATLQKSTDRELQHCTSFMLKLQHENNSSEVFRYCTVNLA